MQVLEEVVRNKKFDKSFYNMLYPYRAYEVLNGTPGISAPCHDCKISHEHKRTDISNEFGISTYEVTCYEKCPCGILVDALRDEEIEYCQKIGRELKRENDGQVLRFPERT